MCGAVDSGVDRLVDNTKEVVNDVSDDNIYWEGFIIPEPLTNDQKKELEEQFRDLWYGHFENGICPKAIADPSKCNPDLLWPNEEAINLFDY